MKHFILSKPSLRKAVALSLCLFLILSSLIFVASQVRTRHLESVASAGLTRGLQATEQTLVSQGDTIAANQEVKSAIKEKDSYAVLSLLNSLNLKKVQGIAAADENGIIFSRTLSYLGRGDNAFVIGPLGRALVRTGKPAASIEVNSRNPSEVIMSTARYVTDNGHTIGAIFTTDFLNDTYAQEFAKSYLPTGSAVLFYTQRYGIYGESITNAATRKIVNTYFHPDSDWVAHGKTGTIVRFPDGSYYAVTNKVFPGLEHSPGGAIVLVPVYDLLPLVRALSVLLAVAFFAFMILHHRRVLRKHDIRYKYLLAAFVFGMMMLAILDLLPYPSAETLRAPVHVLYNSVLKLTPSSQVYDRSYPQSVAVTLDTGPENINTIGIDLGYDPKEIGVQNVIDTGSVCSELIEKTIDDVKGEIHYSCLIPNPGFSGTGNVFTLVFKARTTGVAGLRFLPDTQVLANDGLGTDVLRLATNGSYTAMLASSSAEAALFSPSHPNSEQWYSNRVVDLIWGGAATTTYAYLLDTSPQADLSKAQTTTGQRITVTAPSDGIYYFHLAPITHGVVGTPLTYKVMIDTVPPKDLTIRSSDSRLTVGDILRLELSASDDGSGLQKNYYLSINGDLLLPTHQDVYVPVTNAGTNTVTVRAYDNAGNYSESKTQVQVNGTFLQNLLGLLR